MAIYKVQAPDGKMLKLEGPDGASDSDVIAMAQQLYKSPAAPANDDSLTPSRAKTIWDKQSAALEQSIAGLSEPAKRVGRDKFSADPRIKALREAAGAPAAGGRAGAPVTTREQEIRQIARRNVAAGRGKTGVVRNALSLAIPALRPILGDDDRSEAMFASTLDAGSVGLGDRLRAGVGSLVNGHSNEDNLALAREETKQRREQSTTGNVLGMILGSLGPGAIISGGMKAATKGAAEAGLPRLARFIGSGATMGRTEKVARLATAGAAFGAADAAGHGEDIKRGAAWGAGGSLALGGGAKALGWLGSHAADFLNLSSATGLLRRFTTATKEEIAAKLAEYQKDGLNPTVYELLGLKDRLSLAKNVAGHSADTAEATAKAVQKRAANLGPEMQARVNTVTAERQQRALAQMEADLAASKDGAPLTPDEAQLAQQAGQSTEGITRLTAAETGNIMAPHNDRPVIGAISDLYPQHPVNDGNGQIRMDESDPEISKAIRNASGSLVLRKDGGITVGEITTILKNLRGVANGPASTEKGAAQAAIQHIEKTLGDIDPAAGEAVSRMNAAHAGGRRMGEGFVEGGEQRVREQATRTSSKSLRDADNIFETPEGTMGRGLGQIAQLKSDFNQAPRGNLAAAEDLATNPETRQAITGNLGSDESGALASSAEKQFQSMRALASLSKETGKNADELSGEDLAKVVIAMSPHSMPQTKLRALVIVKQIMGYSDAKAKNLVDALFSQNPNKVHQTINMLNSNASRGRKALQQLQTAIVGGHAGAQVGAWAGNPTAAPEQPAPVEEPVIAPEENLEGQEPAPEASPYAPMLDELRATESPEFLDLIARQKHQESRGRQDAVSPAGAIGVMQVMPETAPEAAELAGLPWDEEAYRSDPVYNELLGIAYMADMLRRFGGDPRLALAAYNAGPGAVQKHGGVPPYAETQDYVARILR